MTVVAISGFTAAGKTTLALAFAKAHQLTVVSAASLIAYYCDVPFDGEDGTFWHDYGALVKQKLADGTIHRAVNEDLIRAATCGSNLVIDSWFLPWLVRPKQVNCVWLQSSFRLRMRRAEESLRMVGRQVPRDLTKMVREKDYNASRDLQRQTGSDLRYSPSRFTLRINADRYFMGTAAVARAASVEALVCKLTTSLPATSP